MMEFEGTEYEAEHIESIDLASAYSVLIEGFARTRLGSGMPNLAPAARNIPEYSGIE